MFYIYSDVTIFSELKLQKLIKLVGSALHIPDFTLDTSGRYEGEEVYIVECFGLEFEIAQDVSNAQAFHLSVNSITGEIDYDGSEKEIDGANYILFLLHKAGIKAELRDALSE